MNHTISGISGVHPTFVLIDPTPQQIVAFENYLEKVTHTFAPLCPHLTAGTFNEHAIPGARSCRAPPASLRRTRPTM